MYSYSLNPGFITNAEIVLSSFMNRILSNNVQDVMDIAEYEQPEAESIDIEDVYLSRSGNNEAYKRLIERHQQSIARIMWRFSRDRLTHEELVQDVFVEAYLSLMTYREQSPFIHWLRKIAVRVGYRYWKEQARHKQRENFTLQEWDNILAVSEEKISSEQAAELIHNLLEQLPPRDRLVLTLRFVDGYDVKQTAYLTGWSKSMVKVQTIRAKRKLKKMFPDA
jgi:RNA polymerase sigma-70 factor (ECF subfamily)